MSNGSWSLDSSILDWIFSNLSDGSSILEIGSGDSTGKLTVRYQVTSIEEDQSFVGAHDGATYVYAPIDPTTKWYSAQSLESLIGKKFDLVIVDGPAHGCRLGLMDHLKYISADVFVFDDTNRSEDRKLVEAFCEDHDCTLNDYEYFCVVKLEKE
jgi:hypothetical protein